MFGFYIKGICYRNAARDIYGGDAHIAGMATFEVTHEDILFTLLDTYANIHNKRADSY